MPNSQQPKPIMNSEVAVWDLVMNDMDQRDKTGEKKYGVRLQPFNGRNSLVDLSQELMDAIVYCKQLFIELESFGNEIWKIHAQLVELKSGKQVNIAQVIASLESLLKKSAVLNVK